MTPPSIVDTPGNGHTGTTPAVQEPRSNTARQLVSEGAVLASKDAVGLSRQTGCVMPLRGNRKRIVMSSCPMRRNRLPGRDARHDAGGVHCGPAATSPGFRRRLGPRAPFPTPLGPVPAWRSLRGSYQQDVMDTARCHKFLSAGAPAARIARGPGEWKGVEAWWSEPTCWVK